MPDTLPVRWLPQREPETTGLTGPPMVTAMWRGLRARCPVCGEGKLFASWLRISPSCRVCGAPLGLIRADDAPPYFTIFIVAHLAIGALVATEHVRMFSVATEMMIFVPGTLALVLVLVRPIKGATVGLMLKLGFMRPPDDVSA